MIGVEWEGGVGSPLIRFYSGCDGLWPAAIYVCSYEYICVGGRGPSVTVFSSMARRGESKGGNWMMAPMVGRGCFLMRKLCA